MKADFQFQRQDKKQKQIIGTLTKTCRGGAHSQTFETRYELLFEPE